MVDDADRFEVAHDALRTARKPHTCSECRRTIEPGEPYEYMQGLLDGCWWTYKTCQHCIAARSWLLAECNGWCYGMVWEDLREHWEEDPLLRTLWLGRVLVLLRKGWHWKGKLVPVPAMQTVARGAPMTA